MRWLSHLLFLVRSLFGKRSLDAQLAEEVKTHLEMATEANLAKGMSPREARFAALRECGNATAAQESTRDERGWVWLMQCGQDVRYAARQLRHAPGFTATVVLTLALGIGACTVVFTAINTTLLHPMAGEPVDRDVLVHETQLPERPQMPLSAANFIDMAAGTQSFELLGAWAPRSLRLEGGSEPLQLRAAAVTPDVLRIWATRPALGRGFLPEEFAGRQRVVMLSHAIWQRVFGAAEDIIGRPVLLNGTPATVVGVMTPDFARYGSDIELWVPLPLEEQQTLPPRNARFLQVMGRLERGVSLAQAQAELDVIAAGLAQDHPDTNRNLGLLVRDFGSYVNRRLAPMLHVLLGAVGCVLLIACANVANLLLARASARHREISIRAALGAGRARLLRQLLVESLLLAAAGGLAGIVLAQWGLRFIRDYGPAAGIDLARLAFLELDPAVLGFTLGFSLLTSLVFGLAPAWLTSRVDLRSALNQGARGTDEGPGRGRLRSMLVAFEVALAVVLLSGAGLLLRSFAKQAGRDPGFQPAGVASMELALSGEAYATNQQRVAFTDALLDRLRTLPDVQAASVASLTPFNNAGPWPFEIIGSAPTGVQPAAVAYTVTSEHFATMGIPLRLGRTFDNRDGVAGPLVFVISETTAHQYFPDESPLGRVLVFTAGSESYSGEIIGVVGDVMQGTPGAPPPPQVYALWTAISSTRLCVAVRTNGDPRLLLPLLKEQLHALNPHQPVTTVRTMDDLFADKLASSHFMMALLGIFGLIALVIAAIGIYGTLAYTVSRRAHEFGIRMALGATAGNLLRHVLGRGLRVIGIGLVIGIVGAAFATRVLQNQLFELEPIDPLTFALVAALLAVIGTLACLLPARRAAKTDPMTSLRAE